MSASTVSMTPASESVGKPGEASTLQRPRGGYRFSGRPLRVAALGATVLVHLAVGAVVMLGWPLAQDDRGTRHLVSITILPHPREEPRRRPTPGTHAAKSRPEPLPVRSSPPPAILLAPPAPIAIETFVDIPAPTEGGRFDALALTTQAYRRAIMARLEAQRARLRQEGAGAGAVLFRIERSGRLIEASVTQTTGSHALDRAALALVRRAAPFPAIPDALPDELEITLPVEFLLAGRVAKR